MSDGEEKKSRCKVCREEISLGAKKCVHCDSFQTWRRHLNFSSTVLSLLVALVSVSGIAFPAITAALHVPKANVIFDVTDAWIYKASEFPNRGFFTGSAYAFNSGDRPGLLRNVKVVFDGDHFKRKELILEIVVEAEVHRRQLVVKPGEFIPLQLSGIQTLPDGSIPPYFFGDISTPKLEVTEFNPSIVFECGLEGPGYERQILRQTATEFQSLRVETEKK